MGFFSRIFGPPQDDDEPESSGGPEAEQRKQRSIAELKRRNVRVMEALPLIEDTETSRLRSPREIVERLIGCTLCAIAGETGDRALIDQVMSDFSAGPFLTQEERRFLSELLDNAHTRVQFSWQYERAWVLLWALGYVDELVFPSAQCDVPTLVGMLRGRSVEGLLQEAVPRTQAEVLDAADFIYRLHWAVRDAQVNGKPAPENVVGGVVMERHVALNWLINYCDQEWDEVSTDT